MRRKSETKKMDPDPRGASILCLGPGPIPDLAPSILVGKRDRL